MSETLLRDDDLIVRSDGTLRRITLNRPHALNAITLDMAIAMTALLREWRADPKGISVLSAPPTFDRPRPLTATMCWTLFGW